MISNCAKADLHEIWPFQQMIYVRICRPRWISKTFPGNSSWFSLKSIKRDLRERSCVAKIA